jgi:hypothetical protein
LKNSFQLSLPVSADESLANRSEVLRVNGGYSSDTDTRKKSKKQKESSVTMNEQQMRELENQLVMKMMKHFKDNYNYSPLDKTSEDIFYSPIGEKKKFLMLKMPICS